MLFFTTISYAQHTIETEEASITDLIIASFDEIWSKLNSKNIGKYYTKDFLLLENGEVWNNDSISNYLDNAILKKPLPERVNAIEVIEVKVYKGSAWVTYRNHATFLLENKIIREAFWIESATATLTENGWKLEMLHSSPAKTE